MSNSNRYFSYIRVSTQRQGQTGTSLAEQQSAIERYATNWNLQIVKHFEERETAAKQGRPVFLQMLKELWRGVARGVIIHKIDRSARNLRDWADLGSLIDSGVEVHFANESLDLHSRGGRLSADIQAVVASDYIRNLREETKKGIYGRLKQGLYPFPAVTGYLDAGKGNPKRLDPLQAPLVKQAFELYASGEYGLIALAERMHKFGLRSRKSNKITINGLSSILHNPFYIGLIKIEKTGELFAGRHQPIISRQLFDKVQDVFNGKNVKKNNRHFFLFRRHVLCQKCRRFFIPEHQKEHIYYRCHTRRCFPGTIKEDQIEKTFLEKLHELRFNEVENRFLRNEIEKQNKKKYFEQRIRQQNLSLKLEQIKERLSKLADGFIDGVFDKVTYIEKKNKLVLEQHEAEEILKEFTQDSSLTTKRLEIFLELVNSAYLSYEMGNAKEKRDLVKNVSSNFSVEAKKVLIKLNLPFQMVVERVPFTAGSPYREARRTLSALFKNLFTYFKELDTSKSDDGFVNYINSKTEKKPVNNFFKSNH